MPPLADKHVGVEDLSAGKHVHAAETKLWMRLDFGDHLSEPLLVETELNRLTAHSHRATAGWRARVNAHGNVHLCPECRQRGQLLVRFQMYLTDPVAHDEFELLRALTGTRKDNPLRGHARGPGAQELRARGDLQARPRVYEGRDDRWIGIRLDRVVNVQALRQRGAEIVELAFENRGVVDE